MTSLRALIFVFGLTAAHMANAATLGVVAPQSGPYEMLGAQIRAGAKAAAAKVGLDVLELHESCEEGSGGALADGLVAAKVSVVIGFLCTETLPDALPILKNASIPAITLSSRSPILMEDALKKQWPLFRLSATEGAESDTIAEIMLRDWKGVSLGLVDDGTIYSRELADRVRSRLEDAGLKPTLNDTLRPAQEQQIALVRRLGRTGITHVLIAAERNDVAIVARDAAKENLPLTILSGDSMRAANSPVPLAEGVLAITTTDYTALPSAADIVKELRAANIEPEGYVLPAFVATQIAAKITELSQSQGKSAPALLAGSEFDTIIGKISFNDSQTMQPSPLTLQRWNGSAFLPVEKAEP